MKLSNFSISAAAFSVVIIWTAVLSGIGFWGAKNEIDQTNRLSRFQARAYFQEIVATRAWNASHGGIYVPVTPEMQPNPYLIDPARDIITRDGKKLTKINPAFMTRQISEIASDKNLFWFHITSANPIRPGNAPDPWEKQAIEAFVQGKDEISEFIGDEGGNAVFRYMAPLWVEKSCLKCHAAQGYKEGDLRGGLSVSISAKPILDMQKTAIEKLSLTYFIIWLTGFLAIVLGYRKLKKDELQRLAIIAQLKESLSKTKTLSGLLPICAICKKIRDDKGYWNQIEAYISEHSDADFSHSICRECAKKHYPDLDIYDENDS